MMEYPALTKILDRVHRPADDEPDAPDMLGVPKGRSVFQIAVHQIRTPQNDERTYQHLPIYFSHLPIILEVHEAIRQTGHMTIMKLLILMHVIGTVLGVGDRKS